jgi:hypothetical protein
VVAMQQHLVTTQYLHCSPVDLLCWEEGQQLLVSCSMLSDSS